MIDDFVEQHRFLGNAVAQIIHEHVATLADRRVTPEATPAQLEKLFDEPLPEKGIPLEDILARFRDDIAPNAMHVPSPRYFGQFNPDAVADWRLGRRVDFGAQPERRRVAQWSNVGNDRSASVALACVNWWVTVHESFGTLASGGTEANLIALKCARDRAHAANSTRSCLRSAPGDLVVYASEQCHFSIDKKRRHSRARPREPAQDSNWR